MSVVSAVCFCIHFCFSATTTYLPYAPRLQERAIVKVEAPPPLARRREVVEVRQVVKPTIKHTVHRVEEKKRTEEVGNDQ